MPSLTSLFQKPPSSPSAQDIKAYQSCRAFLLGWADDYELPGSASNTAAAGKDGNNNKAKNVKEEKEVRGWMRMWKGKKGIE